MDAGIATFKRIHRLRQQIHELEETTSAGPRLVAARNKTIEANRRELESLDKQRLRYRMEGDQNQVKLDAGEERLSQERVRLNAAKDNKEYSATRLEMSRIEETNGKLEDVILDRLGRADEAATKVGALRGRIAEEEALLEQAKQQAEEDRRKVAGKLGSLQAELDTLEQGLAASMRGAYRRLVAAMGVDAMAPVRDKVCGGCYTGITEQGYSELLIGRDMVLCKSCGRILYIDED